MRKLRQILPNQLVEITCRIEQARYLLRPGKKLNRHFLGVLGRAQRREKMRIHAVVVMSNHVHYLLSPTSGDQLVRFMRFLQTNLSKEIQQVRKWKGRVWARRYQSIGISDEDEAQIARLRYVLAHGVKENLVRRVRDWPGIHSAAALLDGTPLTGAWYDRSELCDKKRRKRKIDEEEVAEPETVVLSPLPCWKDLPTEEIRQRVAALVEAIETDAAERRAAEGTRVLGVRRVLRQNPFHRPKNPARSPARQFHTATRAAWLALREAYLIFANEFSEAVALMRQGVKNPPFPPGSFPPGLPFVPHEPPA
jgi:REP element-mobilizing transposase RayT